MSIETVAPGVHVVPLGFVNALILEDDGGPVIVDTGMPGSATKILDGVKALGHAPGAVQKIIITHLHIDHAGSLAELKRATGAPAIMHPVDAALVRRGQAIRPVTPTPGLFSRVMALTTRFFRAELEAATVEEEIVEGDRLPLAGGIQVLHTPGHAAGHVSLYLDRDGGILLVGDAAVHMMGLRYPPIVEDMAAATASLKRLAMLPFNTAVFMHGQALNGAAGRRFADRWGA